MQTVLIDTVNKKVEICDVEDRLEAFYEKLNCNYIEITSRYIDGKLYNVMCDEEGEFVGAPVVSGFSERDGIMFVGNLMFFNDDGEGNLLGLNGEDIWHIMRSIHKHVGYFLVECEYTNPKYDKRKGVK